MSLKRLRSVWVGALAAGLGLLGCTAGSHAADWPADTHVSDRPITRIAFGSCAREDRPQPIWNAIAETEPDLFLFIGDNVYADIPERPKTADDIRATWDQLADRPEWQAFRDNVPILATWDDHDYGLNDSGKEFPLKRPSQQLFLEFFGEPADSPRWDREGIYAAWTFGPEGRRVQIILLDTRYHRDPLIRNPKGREGGLGPYLPRTDGTGELLGESQWRWLEAQLRQPADLRIIGSSIQVVPFEHRWEGWGNFPHERERLYRLIDRSGANGVVFISGDRHLTEVSRDTDPPAPYPLYDFTSSGMNQGKGNPREPNRFRVTDVRRESTFGLIRIDWEAPTPTVTFEARGGEGELLFDHRVPLSDLRQP